MRQHTFNYVRTCRLRHALTPQELAHLINQRSATAISQFEAGDRVPSLEGVLALQVVFGLKPHELFPDFFAKVEEAVMRRAKTQYEELEGNTDPRSEAKRELFDAMPGRSSNHHEG